MKLANNSQSIEDVREDLLLYISLDEDVTSFAGLSIDDILAKVNMIIQSQEQPFQDGDAISNYLVTPIEKEQPYKPAGRINHVSNYYNG